MKIGDIVKLNTLKYGDTKNDPYKLQCTGVVSEIRDETIRPIFVKWSNGGNNDYKEEDLKIYTKLSKDKLNAL